VTPPGHTFKNESSAVGLDDDGSWNPGDSVMTEALRIVLMAYLGEGFSVHRVDYGSCFRTGSAGGGSEKMNAGGQVIPGCSLRPSPSTATGDRRGNKNDGQYPDDDEDPDNGLAHSIGTPAVIPTELPLRTP